MKFEVHTFMKASDPDAVRMVVETSRQSLPTRIFASAFLSVLMCAWVDWRIALGVAAIAIAWDALIVNPIVNREVMPILDTNMRRAEWWLAGLAFFGSAIYCMSWTLVWKLGGPQAGFICGAWFALMLIHALVYFSNVRLVFFACIIPPTLAAVILPFQGAEGWVAALTVSVAAAQMAALIVVAANDRNKLVATLAAQSAARQAAEEASTAKSQFLANMSHELRTPLNAVIGYSEILEEDLEADGKSEGAADANRIRKAARHLLGLINEVLDLSKIEAGRMELAIDRCNIAQIVADAVEQTRPAAEGNGNTLNVTLADDLAPVLADGGKLGQCMLNFLSNAAKFTNNGRIDVRVALDAGQLVFAVEDTGCGIAAEDAKRLFQPFTQVDESFTRRAGGTGLGLVITQRLAELMGGDVALVSTPGQGSTFTLRVPVEAAPVEANDHTTGPTTRACVLVVEDEACARDLTRRALAALPFDVRTASTVAEGIAAFHALDPALVVLDVHLPDGVGWEVLAEVRRTRPGTPVLVVTIDDDRGLALALGASEHIVKPADREQIAATVLRLATAPALRAA